MLRRSLLVRHVVGAIAIATFAIGATAWFAARNTTVAIQEQTGRAIAVDARIYDTLVGYAATHATWDDVGPLIDRLTASTGRTITVATEDRSYLGGHRGPLPSTVSAVVDALAVDPGINPEVPADRIDPRAVGPYRLRPADRATLSLMADALLECVRQRSGVGTIVVDATGRPSIAGTSQETVDECETERSRDPQGPFAVVDGAEWPLTTLTSSTASETKALAELQSRTDRCLKGRGLPEIRVQPNFTWVATDRLAPRSARAIDACVTAARRAQLDPWVAPAALTFISTPGAAITSVDWAVGNMTRIARASAVVLLATAVVSVLGGLRLLRPLRSLTRAAQRMSSGDDSIRVPTDRSDEIGELSVAFNELADSRAHTEQLRRAMVSDIAHELRSPLSNISGWLEAVADGHTRPDERFIDSLREETQLLHNIINDLRDLATVDTGNLRLHTEVVHVATLYDQVLAPYRLRAADRGITLTTDAHDDLELEADPLRMRQVLGNLVDNALRHTRGGGHIHLAAWPESEYVVFEVRDDGSGIEAADLPRVFERFWRADTSRTRPAGGSGLGLAIVRSLVEAHGGRALVRSEPGKGATFQLRLPGTSSLIE